MVVSRQPILINLKFNTMKNTMQSYALYVIQHNFFEKKTMCLTLFCNLGEIKPVFVSVFGYSGNNRLFF